ncbi:Glucan 1,4-alpha-glucosidase SusB [subsurface metagenome]
MKIINIIILIGLIVWLFSCNSADNSYQVASPDGKIVVKFEVVQKQAYYSVLKNKNHLILPSKLGLRFQEMKPLGDHVEVISIQEKSFNETWEQAWGERRLIENKYDELTIKLRETNGKGRNFYIIFRAFNDGIGFRYHIPEQGNISEFKITDEFTEFKLPKIGKAWWIPAYKERFYESLYRFTPLNIPDTVCTPLTIEMGDSSFLSIHEANLTDYAAMNLYLSDTSMLTCDLTPWSTGEKVRASTPFESPWRTIIIAENPGDLITSSLMLNLNEPSKIKDTSWIKTGKYIGIWWGMHQNKYTWSQGPKHGATTANAMRYIDFAAENNFDGVLIEGWNYGWDEDWTVNGHLFEFIKPYPDFDIKKISNYAAKKGVKIIGHHETGGASINYENQLEDAFKFYQKYGVNTVKTGYVSDLLDGKEYHSSQYGVRHFRKVIETAASYHIMIDNHEPVIPTGLQRTFPNLMTQEGVRGQEWDAWSTDGGNPPDHTTVIPFTRGLAGPMDFTFGTFDFNNPVLPDTRVRTTIAKQVALYVVIYSPLQMASDLPENYIDNEAFRFIKEVPTDWEDTQVLKGKIGDYIVIARKDRQSDNWYVGAITDERERSIAINLSFLTSDSKYQVQIIADGEQANWDTNPTTFKYYNREVQSIDTLVIHLAPGGGQAMRFIPQ